MHKKQTAFVVKLLGLSSINLALLLVWNSRADISSQIAYFYLIPVYFFVLTLLLHFRLLKAAEKAPQKFVYIFMASTTIRILITIICFVIYISVIKSATKNFSIAYILSYFVYLFFEVIELQKLFRN